MSLEKYNVRKVNDKVGRQYIRDNHYAGEVIVSATCYGLWKDAGEWWDSQLKGVIAFSMPVSENVRKSVFGKDYKESVIELHRMFTDDNCPKNSGSFFISRALKQLKQDRPHIRAVISFSDTTENHWGTQYQAANAWYAGTSKGQVLYRDSKGNLRHYKQGGKILSKDEIKKRGWEKEQRMDKQRYLWFLPDKHGEYNSEAKLRNMCLLDLSKDYPEKVEGEALK